jgi:glucose/arabinose dehydrogenase
LLRDTNGEGVADARFVFLQGLNSPYGITLVGDQLFVADTDAIRKYAYHDGQTRIDGPGSILTELPAGRINHHWTKNLVASPDDRFLYVSIGSNSNVGENGLAAGRRSGRWMCAPASTVATRLVYAIQMVFLLRQGRRRCRGWR